MSEFSTELGALAKALAKAQSELQDAKKDSENPAFRAGRRVSRYASLSAVREAVTATFSRHGLAVTQLNEPQGEAGVCVVTMLMHESGQWIRSRLYVPVSKKDAQGFGSALTYARRYALAAIANIASDDDDDANDAVQREPASLEKQLASSLDLVEWKKKAIADLKSAPSPGELLERWTGIYDIAKKAPNGTLKELTAAKDARKAELGAT